MIGKKKLFMSLCIHRKRHFNVNETELFFKCTTAKTLNFKDEKCNTANTKMKCIKVRITLLVTENMDGTEKLSYHY